LGLDRCDHPWREERGVEGITRIYQLRPGEKLNLERSLIYADAPALLERLAEMSFEHLEARQRRLLNSFWEDADVQLEGPASLQQGIRFALFQLSQSLGCEPTTSIAAKGLSSAGYEGHIFWDAEIYILPALLYNQPERARQILKFRINTLAEARERARSLKHRGALFPWRTLDGREASAYFPAGTAQYHINADIAYAFQRYLEATQDEALLWEEGGAELILETARFWLSLGGFTRQGFSIPRVTGPDEYSAIVDNNLYTNLMAQAHLRWAAELLEQIQREGQPIPYEPQELVAFKEAAEAIYLPFDREMGLHAQDQGFLDRPEWPFAIPIQGEDLLLKFHPLDLYRYQVLKQADLVLALLLQPQAFSATERLRALHYYRDRTSHDSSLSRCIHGVVALACGELEPAEAQLSQVLRVDLDDLYGNADNGLHMAALGGAWMLLIQGFAGMRSQGGRLSFEPRLPQQLSELAFKLRWRGRQLQISLKQGFAYYRLREGEPLEIQHFGHSYHLETELQLPLVPELKAILFDLDGVLSDTAAQHFQAWSHLAEELGIFLEPNFEEQLKGIGRIEALRRILALGKLELEEEEERALAAQKNREYQRLIASLGPRDRLPGISRFLEELSAAGIRLALCSASRNAPYLLERLGLSGLFELIIDPKSLTQGKPDPEIFLRAAEGLGVHPARCVGIEDALAGVEALRTAGIFAVGLGVEADWRLESAEGLSLVELLRRRDPHHSVWYKS